MAVVTITNQAYDVAAILAAKTVTPLLDPLGVGNDVVYANALHVLLTTKFKPTVVPTARIHATYLADELVRAVNAAQ